MTSFGDSYQFRPLQVDDAAALASAYDRNREHLARWDPIRPEAFYTRGFQALSLRRRLELAGGETDSWVLWCEGMIVGRFNLNNVVRGALQSTDLGYWVDARHTGQGLATAGVAMLIEAAGSLQLHRVAASTLPENLASQRVLERSGFTRYGMAEKFLCINGAWQDSVLFHKILHDKPLQVL